RHRWPWAATTSSASPSCRPCTRCTGRWPWCTSTPTATPGATTRSGSTTAPCSPTPPAWAWWIRPARSSWACARTTRRRTGSAWWTRANCMPSAWTPPSPPSVNGSVARSATSVSTSISWIRPTRPAPARRWSAASARTMRCAWCVAWPAWTSSAWTWSRSARPTTSPRSPPWRRPASPRNCWPRWRPDAAEAAPGPEGVSGLAVQAFRGQGGAHRRPLRHPRRMRGQRGPLADVHAEVGQPAQDHELVDVGDAVALAMQPGAAFPLLLQAFQAATGARRHELAARLVQGGVVEQAQALVQLGADEGQGRLQAVALEVVAGRSQAGLGLGVGDVLQDGDVLGQHPAVVQLQRRHVAEGIDAQVVLAVLGLAVTADPDQVEGQAGFAKGDVRRQRTGARQVVQLHVALHPGECGSVVARSYRTKPRRCNGTLRQFVREGPGQVVELGAGHEDDVGLAGIPGSVVVVVGLGDEEGFQRLQGGGEGRCEDAGLVQLRQVGAGHLVLALVQGEDRRAVLAADVIALAVLLGRVVRHRQEDLQQLPVADLPGPVTDADGLGMAGTAGADRLVVGGVGAAAGVTRQHLGHAGQAAEHRLGAPEAAAGQYGLAAVVG